jgi:hypothetical protein
MSLKSDLSAREYRARYEGDRFKTDNHGDERYISPTGDSVMLKRLAAVAWFGFDVLKGKKVYHNSVPWDIREENLIVAGNLSEYRNKREQQ